MITLPTKYTTASVGEDMHVIVPTKY